MSKVIVQIPTTKKLRDKATRSAEEYGFSSLQEMLRLFMNKIANKEVKITIEDSAVPLSPAAEKRYSKMGGDFRTGKNIKAFDNVGDLMKDLTS